MRADLPFADDELAFREQFMGTDHVPEHHWGAAEAPHLAFAQPVHGFDVSSYQPAGPDFAASGRRLAIWKATEGTGYFDRNFGPNRAKAHSLDLLLRGMYHFARPSSHSPVDEARYFLGHVGARQAGEVAVLDFETSPWSPAWIVQWIKTVQAAGWSVLFYSYLGMISANSTQGIPETGAGLWVAAYGCREPGNDRWPFKTLWQHTDGAGSVCGNDGPWDCSVGDASVVASLAGATPVPTPTPPTFHPSGGQEDSHVAIITGPTGNRVDLVVVGDDDGAQEYPPGSGPVYHTSAPTLPELHASSWENLGGAAYSVSGGWTADGTTFVVAAHGTDNRVWFKAWTAAHGWTDWTPQEQGHVLAPASV